jgi:hypothetical protein
LEQEFRQLPPQQQVSFQNDGDQTPPFIPSGSDKKPGIDDQNPPSIPFIQVEFADSRIQALEAKVAELNKAIEGLQQGYQL